MPLKFTKNQTLILEIFFNHPEKSYYLRELGRLLGKKPGVFQREINKLVEQKILLSKFQANSRFFSLNKKHPLYKELKSIFFKTVGAQAQLKNLLNNFKDVKAAFIFGSVAKKEEDSFSDIDLMVVGDVDENELTSKIIDLEERLDREINYHLFSLRDWQKKLKEKNYFLENITSHRKIFLIGNKNDLAKISPKGPAQKRKN